MTQTMIFHIRDFNEQERIRENVSTKNENHFNQQHENRHVTSLSEYIAFLETLNEASSIYTDKLVWASPQTLELLGYNSLDEVKDTSIYGFNHPDDLIDQQKNIMYRERTKNPTSGTWRFRRKDGTYVTVYSRGSVVTLDGKTYYVAIGRKDEEIQTPQYTSSTLMHETLTPLTAVKGYLEIIETLVDDLKAQDLLAKVQINLKKLEEFIQNYVDETQQFNLR